MLDYRFVDGTRLSSVIESLIFASPEPISWEKLAAIIKESEEELELDETVIARLVGQLNGRYEENDLAFRIEQTGGGYTFVTMSQRDISTSMGRSPMYQKPLKEDSPEAGGSLLRSELLYMNRVGLHQSNANPTQTIQIIKQVCFNGLVNDRFAMFRAEYDVGIDFREGLWHGCVLPGLRAFPDMYVGTPLWQSFWRLLFSVYIGLRPMSRTVGTCASSMHSVHQSA
jgi:hypothetical protein